MFDAAFDPGQQGVSVTVTDGATVVGPLTTDAEGRAVVDLSLFAGSRFRIDVAVTDPSLDYLRPAPAATAATPNAFRSTTTFVGPGTQTVHVGVWNPATYVPRNPQVALVQQMSRGATGASRSIMLTSWNNRGPLGAVPVGAVPDNTGGIADIATQAETGSVFATAWDYRRDALFTAAYAKAYTVYGPGGSGGIYRTDTAASGASGHTVLWATVPDSGTSAHQTTAGRDDAFFLANGREGLGGLALSEDGQTLYAVNLNNRSLYTYDSAAPAPASPIGATPIADPGCVGGEWRPFAVTVRDGEVYVGGICDASTSLARADLAVHILRLDGGAFAPFYTHGLTFPRGSQDYPDPVPNLTDPEVATHWNPWRNTWDADIAAYSAARMPLYPMPLLTTFAFENDGSLILSFRDRKVDAIVANGFGPDGTTPTGTHVSGGDLNKVCMVDGIFQWEGTGGCANNATPANSGGQPAENVEFFPGEFMLGASRYPENTVSHTENSLGAVLLSPREADIAATTMNATSLFNTNGVGFYDRATGAGPGNDWETRGLLVAGNTTRNFGKGNGLGAISMLAAPAPLQIGNLVWFDSDNDGEQDASSAEPAIPGATVRLLSADGTTVLATTTTDANGEYYFGGEGGFALEPNGDYIVEFDLTGIDPATLPGAPGLGDLRFTRVQDAAAGTEHDSNPSPTDVPLIGRAPVTAPGVGGVDHSIDAGIWAQRAGIDLVKFDGRAESPENPVDGPDPVNGEYGGPTTGEWPVQTDADTAEAAVSYPVTAGSTGTQPVGVIVTNTGTLSLIDIDVSDLTLDGPALTDFSCDFSTLGGPSAGTTWAGPFEPGAEFSCSGTLEMGYEDTHHDIASVVAQPVGEQGEVVGAPIGDEDGFWAATPKAPVISVPGGGTPPSTGGLANTGGTMSPIAVLLAVGALGGGMLLLLSRRRRT
ncbi:SdrD B-like domain-containing protein [Microbacterium sp. NPDC012755]|uniref:SdrD B-like domain-containing protein n=1 Tax=Microbacterium sp. NPDC012755 TaxID=3364184 RepID=UPI00367B037A